jgi:hypothetical protein
MNEHVVTATSLNLRNSALVSTRNVLAVLPNGSRVDVLDASGGTWWKVTALLGVQRLTGFCAGRYLKPATAQPPQPDFAKVAPVHMPANAGARRDSASFRHCPLGESSLPRMPENASRAERVAALHAIVAFLDVERSRRYLPTQSSTFCNIYVYDCCYAAAAYLPRVWFTPRALIVLSRGEAVTLEYAKTVTELNANALYDWLREWGDDFGWREAADPTEMQQRVNEGRAGVVCAKRRDTSRSGHITFVLPETGARTAIRAGSVVTGLLQSQAGARNKQSFANSWWLSPEYSGYGFWSATKAPDEIEGTHAVEGPTAARESLVQISASVAGGIEWGTGTLVAGGFVLTAAHVVAPTGNPARSLEHLVVKSRESAARATVRRLVLLDRWRDARSPLADMALLDVRWQSSSGLRPFELDVASTTVGDRREAASCGYEPGASSALWQGTGEVEHMRSTAGLEFFGSGELQPAFGASGGPLLTTEPRPRLIGLVTGRPAANAFTQIALPLSVATYDSLRHRMANA